MDDPDDIFSAWQLNPGRCFGSKSGYRDAFPDALFYPNSWVGDTKGKLWGGDLDLSGPDLSRLQKVAQQLGTTLYVLREQVKSPKGKEVSRRAEVIVTATDATLTPAAMLNLPKALAGGAVRLTRTYSHP